MEDDCTGFRLVLEAVLQHVLYYSPRIRNVIRKRSK